MSRAFAFTVSVKGRPRALETRLVVNEVIKFHNKGMVQELNYYSSRQKL